MISPPSDAEICSVTFHWRIPDFSSALWGMVPTSSRVNSLCYGMLISLFILRYYLPSYRFFPNVQFPPAPCAWGKPIGGDEVLLLTLLSSQVDGARFSMGFSSFPCKGVESFCPDNLWQKPFFAPGPLLSQLCVSGVSEPITFDFSESHLTARMVTKKPHLALRQFLSWTVGAVIGCSLDDPISITYSSHSSFPSLKSQACERQIKKLAYRPLSFHCWYACPLWISCQIMELWNEEKSYHWVGSMEIHCDGLWWGGVAVTDSGDGGGQHL